MKPMVVSAAKARPAPKVLPSAIAAPPCNRCRREILPKSICLLPLADEPPHISQPRRHGGARRLCRNFRAKAQMGSKSVEVTENNYVKYWCYVLSNLWQGHVNFIFSHHFLYVCI